MPLYEYQCRDCGVIFDEARTIADRLSSTVCPMCQAEAEFIISKPAVQVDTAADVPWLRDFASKRKEARFGHKPIQTRTEYHQYLKDNDLRPAYGENLSEV